MANDLNQCNFIGRLGKDPETRYLPSGEAVTNISIAVGWKSKDKEGAEWVPVTAFGKLSEIMSQYLTKGSQVFISGRFKTDKYEKDGETRYSTKIIADKMQMLDSCGDSTKGAAQQSNPAQHASGNANQPNPTYQQNSMDNFDDDIPF